MSVDVNKLEQAYIRGLAQGKQILGGGTATVGNIRSVFIDGVTLTNTVAG